MEQKMLQERTQAFALRVVRLFQALPRTSEAYVIGKQLLRSGTSVGANYRAACRARSTAEFIAKLGIVQEEADETLFWLELLRDSRIVAGETVATMINECDQIVAMTTASKKTAEGRRTSAPVAQSS